MKKVLLMLVLVSGFIQAQDNGYSPYNAEFGSGIYQKYTQNSFTIKNGNTNDVVVLLVNVHTNRKVRNEYIKAGQTFKMTDVPPGTYILNWRSGSNWSYSSKKFLRNDHFTKSEKYSDRMTSTGRDMWTVTLYTVSGGNMGTQGSNKTEFFN